MFKKNFLILLSVIFILTSLSFGVFASPIAPENTTEATTQISAEESSSAEAPEDTTVSDEGTTVSGEETTALGEETTVAEETTAGGEAVTEAEATTAPTDADSDSAKVKVGLIACVAGAAVCVILIIVLVVMLIMLKKKKKASGDKPRKVQGLGEEKAEGSSVQPSQVAASAVQGKKTVTVSIPQGIPAAINATIPLEQNGASAEAVYTAETDTAAAQESAVPASPEVKETALEEIQAQLVKLYDGTMKPADFTEKVDALLIKNLYEMNISSTIAPVFETTDNISSARFVVVAGKYLYINFHSYSKSDFRLYSDLEGVDRCFDINMSGNRVPYGNAIKSVEPAKVELVNNTYTLTEKGKIVVEL